MKNQEEPKSNEIRALWWKQPFASAMFHGKIETRTWSTNYRGLVLICTTKVPYDVKMLKDIAGVHYEQLLEITKDETNIQNHGFAIGIAELVDCRLMKPDDASKCFVEYKKGLYCHEYRNVMPIKPFALKGCQGWKKLSTVEVEKIEYLSDSDIPDSFFIGLFDDAPKKYEDYQRLFSKESALIMNQLHPQIEDGLQLAVKFAKGQTTSRQDIIYAFYITPELMFRCCYKLFEVSI